MAKQLIVARGQIEKGKEVVAKQGDAYKPKDAADEKRLLDAGVLVEAGTDKAKSSNAKPSPPATGSDGVGGTVPDGGQGNS